MDKKFRQFIIAHNRACAYTNYEGRGLHVVQRVTEKTFLRPFRVRTVSLVRNAIRQAPYMAAPPKGCRYARDTSKPGMVPMLVRR